MRISKAAKDKWLAACLFSATVLTGFQLQQMNAQASSQTQTTTTVTSTPSNGSASGTKAGSFATSTSTVTSSSASTSTAPTSPHSDSSSASSSSTAISNTSAASTDSSTKPKDNEANSSSAPVSDNTDHQPSNDTDNSSTQTETMGHLKINTLNGVTNSKIDGDTFTGDYQGTIGSSVKDKSALVPHIPGYSFVGNADTAIPDSFQYGTQTANLYYMPLSTIVVRYVDVNDPSKVLWAYSMPTNYATMGQIYSTDDNLLSFAGYTLDHVSGDSTGIINQTVKSPTVANPITVTYYYKPESDQTGTLDTSNWIMTSKTTPIGLTGKYSFSIYLQRDGQPAIQIGSYGSQSESGHTHPYSGSGIDGNQSGSGHTHSGGGTSDNHPETGQTHTGTGTGDNQAQTGHAHINSGSGISTSTGSSNQNAETNKNTQPDYTATITAPVAVLTRPVLAPTATVNVVTEVGNPIGQLTVSGKPGTNVRTQIQQQLNQMRKSGFVILSNGVKGNTTLGTTNSVLTIKVSRSKQQANPFQHNAMPIVTQLGNASQPAHQAAIAANSNRDSSGSQSAAKGNSRAGQNNAQQKQSITQNHNSTQATSKDTEQNGQIHRDTIANNGQSFQHAAADNGGGGNQISELAAYFISLSGTINLGSRV